MGGTHGIGDVGLPHGPGLSYGMGAMGLRLPCGVGALRSPKDPTLGFRGGVVVVVQGAVGRVGLLPPP